METGKYPKRKIKENYMKQNQNYRKWMAVGMSAVLLLGTIGEATTVFAGNREYKVSVNTTIKDADKEMLAFGKVPIRLSEDGNGAYIIDLEGNAIQDLLFKSADSPADGFYTGRLVGSEGPDTMGLVAEDGEILIPFDAASINMIDGSYTDASARFAEVIYATEETDVEEECFIYFTETISSMTVGEEAKMFKGYARIYDLENRCFVEGIEVTNTDLYAEDICDDSIVVDHGEQTVVYAADGTVLLETTNDVTVCNHLLFFTDGDVTNLYDSQGSLIASTKNTLEPLEGDYIIESSADGKEALLDQDGNAVLSFADGTEVYKAVGNLAYAENKESSTKELVRISDGSVLAESAANIYYLDLGYWYTTDDDAGSYKVYDEDGFVVECLQSACDLSALLFLDVENKAIFCLNTAAYQSNKVLDSITGYDTIAPGLIYVGNTDGKMAVLDLFTGKLLIDYQYTDIDVFNGRIYAYKGDSWDVYDVTEEF